MQLKIAGGCGEHGRNCFHIKGEETNFLLDCGILNGTDSEDRFPHLSPEEIPQINTVFLSHSHSDHCGGLKFLYENGFDGEIIASAATLRQLPFAPKKAISLEDIKGSRSGIDIRWGRSGHCEGSVWLLLGAEKKSIFYSGDYSESSPIYDVDAARGVDADIAIIDAAYGKRFGDYDTCVRDLVNAAADSLEKNGRVILPVPQYGRGLDLLYILSRAINTGFYGDERFIEQVVKAKKGGLYYRDEAARLLPVPLLADKHSKGFIFITDPQLKSEAARELTMKLLNRGAGAIMTGTPEDNSLSRHLIESGKMEFYRYPVHQDYSGYRELAAQNNFDGTVPFHSIDISTGGKFIF